MRVEEKVVRYYSKYGIKEWRRLFRSPYNQIEFITTMFFLKKYLPKKGLILDAGGGPGRYTIELARMGYDVVLLDITSRQLEIAKRKIREFRVQDKVKKVIKGSITNLSMFDSNTFDAVLCLSTPLSHIIDNRQRNLAVKELVRVVKKGAPIFVSVIGRFAILRIILQLFPSEMKNIPIHLKYGNYIPGRQIKKSIAGGRGFTAFYAFLPEELRELFEKNSVKVLELVALEGLSSNLRKETNRAYKNKKKWNIWIDALLKTCNHPNIVGIGEHILLVGRKLIK